MEDLVPFLIFIVIALINLVKFVLEKGAKGKRPSAPSDGPAPKRQPSSLEEFFENLAEKLEPKPAPAPDWPEGYERPDYMKEMEAFERASEEPDRKPVAETIPFSPELVEIKMEPVPPVADIHAATQKMAMKSMPSSIASLKGSRIATAPILRSGTAGSIDFPLGDKAALKKAIIANIVFSPPRAFATDFENTIVK